MNLDNYINSASTPLNKEELFHWHNNIESGYQKGLSFIENGLKSYFAELDRDFKGFLLFYILQDQGLIQPIKITSNKKEYIVKENELRIGDELFLLSEPNFDIEKYLNRLKKMEGGNEIY
ncbi:type IV secretory system conjugative DNA transfer family protein [Abyssogena phaseoliformis symbiont]|uniref:type IV secretory system conjugative DNA transfer family protein n=1 Tax=Abyssogena phaseoliformis symbiont TaxID=596095 RepID=UPI001916A254